MPGEESAPSLVRRGILIPPRASRLLSDAPTLHRVLHRATASGLRGSSVLWRLGGRLRPLPPLGHWSPDGRLAVRLQPSDPGQTAELGLYQGLYERVEREVVELIVADGSTCVDVGASFGMYTVLLASLVGPSGRVVACEPSPRALPRLGQAVATIPWVDVHPVAVGARRGEATLIVAPGDSMHSSLRRYRPPSGEARRVRVQPLADLVSSTDEIAFIKVDVEGYESQVLAGMSPLLDAGRIAYAMFEAEPAYGDLAWVRALNDKAGYTTYRLQAFARGARWSPRLSPLRPGEEITGTLIVIRDDKQVELRSDAWTRRSPTFAGV
jgi:FkbM family methyltransferase